MPKNDELRYGPPGETAVHLCVDMQRMFAEGTEWKMPSPTPPKSAKVKLRARQGITESRLRSVWGFPGW